MAGAWAGLRQEAGPTWLWIGVLLGVALVFWGLLYQPYLLPNSDFYRIQEMAELLATGQFPQDFKQMPLVPLLIASVAWVLPIQENVYLHAISVLNIALSLGSLVLLYFLARVFLGGLLALIPVLLLLATPQFTVSALQPMLEPTIGFFTLATLLALAYRPRWAYVFAGLCALARYELAVLLAVVFIVQVYREPALWFRTGLLCTLAGLPFLVWFGLSLLVAPEGNPYLGEMVRASVGSVVWNKLYSFPTPTLMMAFIGLGATLGVAAAFVRAPSVALGVVAFFVLYTAAHYVYGRPLDRYGYAVLWVLPLFVTVAFHVLFLWGRTVVERLGPWAIALAAGALAIAASYLIARALSGLQGSFASVDVAPGGLAAPVWYLGWSVVLAALIVLVVAISAWRARRVAALGSLAAVAIVVMPMLAGSGALANRVTAVFYDKAELVVTLEWLKDHLEADAAVVLPRYHEPLDGMRGIGSERVVRYSDFTSADHQEFKRDLDERGVGYAVFLHRPERPVDTSNPLYSRNLHDYWASRTDLMDPFRAGGEVAGFELVATLPPPHPVQNHATYVYRRIAADTVDDQEERND